MQDFESVKDRVWYKLPLVGVLPQASFRLTAVGWGWIQPNSSRPSTPPGSAAVVAPGCGSSRLCIAASSELTRCAGLVTLRCCWCTCSARPSAKSEWRNLWTKLKVWRRSGSTGTRAGGPMPWGLPCPLSRAGTLPWRTSSLVLLWLRLRLLLHELLPSGPASCNPARKTRNTMRRLSSCGTRGMVSER